jgi:starch phosphorylase
MTQDPLPPADETPLSAMPSSLPIGPHNLTRDFRFRIDATVKGMKASIQNHLKFTLARDPNTATRRDWYLATAHAVRDRIMERFIATMDAHECASARRVYYLSLEYLMGRMLHNNLYNAGLFDVTRDALAELGHDLPTLSEDERDMGLGNGGLGRLAACFLDSLATLDLPAIGYGIFYEFGLFTQRFIEGKQTEFADDWLQSLSPWFVMRTEYAVRVKLYGRVETLLNDRGDFTASWVEGSTVLGIPHDLPICGYGGATVNFLRLWESRATTEFDLRTFNEGGYVDAVREKATSETITKVLYPSDSSESGKELRLVQQYFFVACSLKDIIRRYTRRNATEDGLPDWNHFADKVAIQLNDTHPAVAIPELMRVLVDESGLEWDRAWGICQRVFSYTNHTLLPEALEKWSVPLMEKVLPRHIQIIYEINARFLASVAQRWPDDADKLRDLSIIEEGYPKYVRMAHLSVVACHTVNGVAALHTELLRQRLFRDFETLSPGKLQNKTNGITPRRWLKQCNPRLSGLLDEALGDNSWPGDLDKLRALERLADDAEFQQRFMGIKHANKQDLAALIEKECEVAVDPSALFDVQIKRLHAYKRQHLNLLHIVSLYRRMLHQPDLLENKRVFVFGAKAAPGYDLAKRIIFAINAVAKKINGDPRLRGALKVAFLPNYSVSLAERIIPATDLSEQISTAGKEASGTGNMKLALNGALTIGTLDGANVEILEEVGQENIFIFGNTVEQLDGLRASGYDPWDYYHRSEELRLAIDWLRSGFFAPEEELRPLVSSLLDGGDPFFVLADFEAYREKQLQVDRAYSDRARWAQSAILNTARVGKFSSDRTIREYARDIWHLEAVRPPGYPT